MPAAINTTNGHVYMPVIVIQETKKRLFGKNSYAIPIYAPFAFINESQAEKYFSTFIKDLVASNDIPSDSITKDGHIDNQKVKCLVKEVVLAELYADDEDNE